MKVLFAVNSNGLGHATRTLPLIVETFKQGHDVYVISNFRALDFLQNEFKDKVKRYFKLPDYSFQTTVVTEEDVSVKRFMYYLPKHLQEFRKEHKEFQKIHKAHKFDLIISDTRYGVYSKGIPSFLLHLYIKIPQGWPLKISEKASEKAFDLIKNKFTKYLIPDFKENSMAGVYTHDFRYLQKRDFEYLGILSMIKNLKVEEDIDYFFSVSGPEPQRTVFEKIVLKEAPKIKNKKIVITLGKPELNKYVKKGNMEIYGFLDREKQTEMMNRAKLVVTRSGYTTVMDLAELGKKALYIPTKGAPEQEYLAEYHLRQGNNYYKNLEDLNLIKDLEIASRFPGYQNKLKTKDAIKKFSKIVFKK